VVPKARSKRGAKVRLIRDNVVITRTLMKASLSTLKRFKDEVKEVQVGQECGMAFENYKRTCAPAT
jgi:translation initiation factor IF-2